MLQFPIAVALEAALQSAIGAAVGMDHQDDAAGLVEKNGFLDLIENEFAIRRALRRRQALGSAGDLDGIGIDDPDALQEFAETKLESIVEAPDDGRVAAISFAGRVEVEELFQIGYSLLIF